MKLHEYIIKFFVEKKYCKITNLISSINVLLFKYVFNFEQANNNYLK